jgi:flagellar hook-associated protein 3 FlgL
MTFRISTAGMHNAVITQLEAQQAGLAKTQSQVASGKRVQSPIDDPIAATQIMTMQAQISQVAQYKTNADAATTRLNTAEQAFSSLTNLLQHVRDLVVQANTGTVDANSRTAISSDLQTSLQQLQAIGNQKDANGDYLFAGLSSLTQPFAQQANGSVSYLGDQGVRSMQLGASQTVQDGFSGDQVFMNIPAGNGTFTTAASAANTGSGSIDPGQVTNAAAWVKGTYQIQFTSPSTYQVVDATNTVITSGAYTDGSAISFLGVQVTLSGTPATGDSFTVSPAGKQDIFTSISKALATLKNATDTPAGHAQVNTSLTGALGQLDNALNHVGTLRADLGSRLNLIDGATAAGQQLSDSLTSSVSSLSDLDYAQAVSSMNQQLLGLQAAQQAYVKISQLSLFQYL